MKHKLIAGGVLVAVVVILAVLLSSCTMAPTQPYSADDKPPFYRSDKDAITYGPVSFEQLEKMKKVAFSSPHPRDFKLFHGEGGIVGIELISADSVNQMFPDFGHYSTVLESCGYSPVAEYYAVKINGIWFNGETEICVRRFESNNPKIAPFVYLTAGFGYKKPAYSLIVPVSPDSQAYYVLYGVKDKNNDLVMLSFDVILTDPAAQENPTMKTMPAAAWALIEFSLGLVGGWAVDNYVDCPNCQNAVMNYNVAYSTLSADISLVNRRAQNYTDCCSTSPIAGETYVAIGFNYLNAYLQTLVDLTNPCPDCSEQFNAFTGAVNQEWEASSTAEAWYDQAREYCSNCIGTHFAAEQLEGYIRIHSGLRN